MDPLSMLVIIAIASGAVDWCSGGMVRADIGGALRGATKGVWEYERTRSRNSRARRRDARSATWYGRTINALDDEVRGACRSSWTGLRDGAKSGHADWRANRWPNSPIRSGANRVVDRAKTLRTDDPSPPEDPANRGPEQANVDPKEPRTDPPNDPNPQVTGGEPVEADEELVLIPDPATSKPNPNEATGTTPNEDSTETRQPEKEGTKNMSDITNAPALIAFVNEMLKDRLEEVIATLRKKAEDVHLLPERAGIFAIGGEEDLSGGLDSAIDQVTTFIEMADAYVDRLYDEYSASIEAAEGKAASAHAPMQEG